MSRTVYAPRATSSSESAPSRFSAGTVWRVSASATGPRACVTIHAHASAVSTASAGRITVRPGIARSASSCSIGWWVGPSSPTKIESCVKTKVERARISAASRSDGRM